MQTSSFSPWPGLQFAPLEKQYSFFLFFIPFNHRVSFYSMAGTSAARI